MGDLKSILVHLDASARNAQRLQAARQLGTAFGAEVRAVYAVMPTVMQYSFALTPDAGLGPLLAFEAEARDRVRAVFEQHRQAAGQPDMVWHEVVSDPLHTFAQLAYTADLLVLGQPEPGAPVPSCVPTDFAASVLVETGKPALVLPYIGSGPRLGQNVLVAWKASPESARALTAALPLLRQARQVHVALWSERSARDDENAPAAIDFLRRHGIEPTLHRGQGGSAEVGALMLSLATDLGADLLVSGCYGHGRAREWILGGVTRTLFESMTLPVLMAH